MSQISVGFTMGFPLCGGRRPIMRHGGASIAVSILASCGDLGGHEDSPFALARGTRIPLLSRANLPDQAVPSDWDLPNVEAVQPRRINLPSSLQYERVLPRPRSAFPRMLRFPPGSWGGAFDADLSEPLLYSRRIQGRPNCGVQQLLQRLRHGARHVRPVQTTRSAKRERPAEARVGTSGRMGEGLGPVVPSTRRRPSGRSPKIEERDAKPKVTSPATTAVSPSAGPR